jgi:hypothetical protein
MPVAIPASITSSNVHVPSAVPVSWKFRLFKFFIAKLLDWLLTLFIKVNLTKCSLVVGNTYLLIFMAVEYSVQSKHNWIENIFLPQPCFLFFLLGSVFLIQLISN